MKSILELKTEKILLRDIEGSDIDTVFRGLSNPDVIKHYGVSFDSLEETKEQMKWFADTKQKWFAICSADNNVFYGAGGLNDISKKHKKAEIGLWLLPEYWGKGIMKKVVPVICDYGFDKLELHRIEGFVDSENKNCKRAMSALDFELEGTMRDCEIKNNKFVSIEVYSTIRKI
ncbi:GNAT family N-acetyltransferase [Flavobacteriaceae bacterium]|nr:GNAT family N-acetyltransferase [Flavobacteriaceae bacterium]MDA7724080.1 GNAT family N-acetyltransferase [Flavobacteriaceae bacterium]MDA7727547.1 GNAT family N-acetyltransferase [Flavobacteriaceae bacterium]MDA7849293.1 GNAT family N-acetyltransferase [Flavobacteriaceae bacterium]